MLLQSRQARVSDLDSGQPSLGELSRPQRATSFSLHIRSPARPGCCGYHQPLISQSTEPRSLDKRSPWVDRRFPLQLATCGRSSKRNSHRRVLKSHLPLDGLPLFDNVRYIHVARDGRDVCMSYHNHITGFTPETLARLDREGLQDRPSAGPILERSAEFFSLAPNHHDATSFAYREV